MGISVELPERAPTGVAGLDEILDGGLPRGWTYLIHGHAGTGKTTLSLHFLREGVRAGERVLYVSLMQSREELANMARSHGWSLEGIEFLDLPESVRKKAAAEQTVFAPNEIQLQELTETIVAGIKEYRPERLVLDSISELAVLAATAQQLRGPVLGVKDLLQDTSCTALFTCGEIGASTLQLRTLLHGVIELEISFPSFAGHRRRLKVTKVRGMPFLGGYHDFRIRTGGMDVFPRLRAGGLDKRRDWETIASGVEEIDTMLGGGLEEGTACLMTGTSGSGKSTLASLYVRAAAEKGKKSVIFCFDERRETFLRRSVALGLPMPDYIERGLVDLRQVAVGEMSPGEFSHAVRSAVEEGGASVVVIDSVSGYMSAMPDQVLLTTQLHELLSYLSGAGVLTLMVLTTHGIYHEPGPIVDASYIADTVILLRHFEAHSEMRHCIAVVKKRHGNHEKTIREFMITSEGCRVGEPLPQFTGLLTGTPTFSGDPEALMTRTKGAGNEDDEG